MNHAIPFSEFSRGVTRRAFHVCIAACALTLTACIAEGTDATDEGWHPFSDAGAAGYGGQSTGGKGGAGGAGLGGSSNGGSAGIANTGGVAGSSNSGGSSNGGSGNAGGAGTGGSGNSGGGPGGIWHPSTGTSWQWQLTGSIDTGIDVAMFDIDLFDAEDATITKLHADGRKVVCYFSAGSREDWRPDAEDFVAADFGNGLDGWAGENWLDTRSQNVRAVMKKRLDLAKSKGCDGVEPDNVDGYSNDSGFPLQKSDQLDYNGFLATEAHARGLSVGLKNAVDLAAQLEPQFDWALNEECISYSECDTLKPFVDAGKAVFHVEYAGSQSQGQSKLNSVCGDSSIQGFSTLIKLLDLDAWRLSCP
jgi:endo-alpha-1,4-polygalactosaminidase (GH114 family)